MSERDSTMKLDVIVPTYNRQEMLKRTLDSLLAARVPDGLSVRITVVDNNSKDETRRVMEDYIKRYGASRLSYLLEKEQGRSPALNAGIRATDGDLVGTIDDDEEIDAGWYEQAYEAFSDTKVDFIGGPCAPRWGMERPEWFPLSYRGVVGWVDGGDRKCPFDEDYPGILMGGNSVLRRSVLEKVGLYTTALGRTDKHLLSCEDEDMYHRLRESGARGFYLPGLIIYHYIPPERLTKRYFRQWCFWRGVSMGVIDRGRRSSVAYLLGVPRWIVGKAVRGALSKLARVIRFDGNRADGFADELAVWDFAGFFYGKHFYKQKRGAGATLEAGNDSLAVSRTS
ncbi:MAG TPA: glycosyltransferase family 2 protein [Pyrinomonadaceae bacterium]|jgi:glycosyltransferase involved in cell wall biosynthesis